MLKGIIGGVAILLLGIAIGSGFQVDRCYLARFSPASSPNWSCISHEVQESLIAAENAAIVTGRRELDDWHSAIMAKVERDFLEEHLSFLNKWASLGIYWRDRIWRDADTATRAAFERQNELFRRTVVSDDELKGFTQTVAEKMVSGFAEVLDTRLTGTAQRYRLSVNELDQHILDALNTAPIDVGDISAKDAHRIHLQIRVDQTEAQAGPTPHRGRIASDERLHRYRADPRHNC